MIFNKKLIIIKYIYIYYIVYIDNINCDDIIYFDILLNEKKYDFNKFVCLIYLQHKKKFYIIKFYKKLDIISNFFVKENKKFKGSTEI
jgi:hypothetical protein